MRWLIHEPRQQAAGSGDHDGPRPIGHFIPEVLARHGIDRDAIRRESRLTVLSTLEPATSGFGHGAGLLAMR